MLIGALAVVFVGYSETLAAARSVARKYRYELDTNQELVAQGMANGAAGLVGGFVVDGSLSKTSVADDAGQKTELASLINAVFILATMLFLATLFESLPGATLGAVVIDAMVGLITFDALQRYYRVNRIDWLFFMGAGLGILFFGIMAGILIGVILSLVMLIARSSRTNIRRLYRDPASGSYHDVSRHEGLEPIPGIVIARVDGPLFFADADRFRERLHELVGEEEAPRFVVVDAEAVHLTDTDGADILIQVEEELRSQGTALALARVHPPVLALWERAGVIEAIGEDKVFDTVRDAVQALSDDRPKRNAACERSRDVTDGRREIPASRTPVPRPIPRRPRPTSSTSAQPQGKSSPRPKTVPHFTPAERAARGKAARSELPRSAHGAWEPGPKRRDPVELLEEQARTRLPELGPIRYGRMLASPFTFFRGGAYLMAADLADGPRTGLHAQLCGDAHLSNFGIFAAPDRRLVFSINDFDETLPGPFEWDVKRLAASFASRAGIAASEAERALGRDDGGA